MDGSAAAFVAAIDQVGIVPLPAARRFTKVIKPVCVKRGDSYGELRPYIAAAFGSRSISISIIRSSADNRWQSRWGRPASAANWHGPEPSASCATSISSGMPVTPGEPHSKTPSFCRTIGCSIQRGSAISMNSFGTRRWMPSAIWPSPVRRFFGIYRSIKGGHKLNHAVLSALIADPGAFTVIEQSHGRSRARADRSGTFVDPAFVADRS